MTFQALKTRLQEIKHTALLYCIKINQVMVLDGRTKMFRPHQNIDPDIDPDISNTAVLCRIAVNQVTQFAQTTTDEAVHQSNDTTVAVVPSIP